MTSVFADHFNEAWPHRFHTTLAVRNICGGIPSDPKVAEGWIRTKIEDSDDRIRQMVAEAMIDRGIDADAAADEVAKNAHLVGFKRDSHGLYIENRNAKSALKEAVMVAAAAGKIPAGRGAKWGATGKGLQGYFAEHVMVLEDRIHLGVDQPTDVLQMFVHTHNGDGITLREWVEECKVSFTVITDHDFTATQWADIWCKGEQQGIGANRSQGFGRYDVVRWDKEES